MSNVLTQALASAVSAVNPFAKVTEAVATVVDRLVPDRAEAERLVSDLRRAAAEADQTALQGALDIAKAEAASGSMFVAGGRPAMLWVCAAGWALIGLGWFGYPMVWAAIHGQPIPAPSDAALDTWLYVTGSLAGFRSLETVLGKARATLRPR